MRIELDNDEAKRRIINSINDCQRFISIEEGRSADLRPVSVKQHLDFCHKHMAKLLNALDAGYLEI